MLTSIRRQVDLAASVGGVRPCTAATRRPAASLAALVALAILSTCCGSGSGEAPDGGGPLTDGASDGGVLPDLGPAQDAPATELSYHITAPLTYQGGTPWPAVSQVAFALSLKRTGTLVSGYAGALRQTPGASHTVAVQGTVKDGKLSLGAFKLPLNATFYSACYILQEVLVDSFDALIGANGLTGTLKGRLVQQEDDIMRLERPVTAAITGTSNAPASVLWTTLPPLHVLNPPAVGFSEPVCMTPGGVPLVISAAGKQLWAGAYTAATDPAGCITVIKPQLPGRLPFGTSVTYAAAAGLTDLAGAPLATPASRGFATVADPGDLPNPGFETGDLSGYVVWPQGSLVKVLSAFGPHTGQYAALLDDLDIGQLASITARIDLPATAQQVLVAVDLLGHYKGSSVASGVEVVVSDLDARKVFPLNTLLKTAELALPAAAGFYPWHSGYHDLALDVSAFAGKSVALTIGKLSGTTLCGPTRPPFGNGPGLLIDDIRVQ